MTTKSAPAAAAAAKGQGVGEPSAYTLRETDESSAPAAADKGNAGASLPVVHSMVDHCGSSADVNVVLEVCSFGLLMRKEAGYPHSKGQPNQTSAQTLWSNMWYSDGGSLVVDLLKGKGRHAYAEAITVFYFYFERYKGVELCMLKCLQVEGTIKGPNFPAQDHVVWMCVKLAHAQRARQSVSNWPQPNHDSGPLRSIEPMDTKG
ncbi:hypothetical protein BDK51DRAFT_30279 [Blyttiomyces helicus]|uniref:Uncharacterized protein n=1 Tax=Blyttiomyces helicus TaxID=388810 RepID=A0A4P9WHF0_9FUNG|nr:hypothetical protein BDK51DRAFT_30279 [Blyttiomyces helicus]|eukprot:RKO92249.1 hypothetical protein BDK51DRAFT_30279 [Blyttiomyces helicus]